MSRQCLGSRVKVRGRVLAEGFVKKERNASRGSVVKKNQKSVESGTCGAKGGKNQPTRQLEEAPDGRGTASASREGGRGTDEGRTEQVTRQSYERRKGSQEENRMRGSLLNKIEGLRFEDHLAENGRLKNQGGAGRGGSRG